MLAFFFFFTGCQRQHEAVNDYLHMGMIMHVWLEGCLQGLKRPRTFCIVSQHLLHVACVCGCA